MRKRINEAVVSGEAWTSAFEKIIQYWPFIAGFLSMSGLGTWAASGVTLLKDQGWGAFVLVGIGGGCAVTLAISAAFATWRYFRPRKADDATLKSASQAQYGEKFAADQHTENATPRLPIDVQAEPKHLTNMILYEGNLDQIPLNLVASVGTTTDRLRVFVDYAKKNGGNRGEWMERRRTEIAELADLVKGTEIRVPVINTVPLGKNEHHPIFGTELGVNNKNTVGENKIRARLAIVGANGDEQHYYFMLVWRPDNATPYAVFQNADFNFIADWQTED